MTDVITRNTPTTYTPLRILFKPDGDGGIVAIADFQIRNSDGQIIDNDHPVVELTEQERATFLTWFENKCSAYETATGLERYTPPQGG